MISATHLIPKNLLTLLLSIFSLTYLYSQSSQTTSLSSANSFTSISSSKKMFRPFLIEDDQYVFPNTTLMAIGKNGKIGFAENQFSDWRDGGENIGYLIDLHDGAIVFQFPYIDLSLPFFGFDDTVLYFYDNKFIKQLSTKTYEISNLIEIESDDYPSYLGIEGNILHCSVGSNLEIVHYSYSLSDKKINKEVINLPDPSYRGNVGKILSGFQGNTAQKLLTLRLICGRDIEISPLRKNSSSEFIIMNYPQVTIVKNGVVTFNGEIEIQIANKATGQYSKEETTYRSRTAHLTLNNEVVVPLENKLYVLQIDSALKKQPGDAIGTIFKNPFEITILANDEFRFANINEKIGKLIYQVNIGLYCNYDDDYEIYVADYKKSNPDYNKKLRDEAQMLLLSSDKALVGYSTKKINSSSLKHEPLESDEERYLRLRNSYSSGYSNFILIQDSLTNTLNDLILDSMRTIIYSPQSIFTVQNYDILKEYWRLTFDNPYGGKDFTFTYFQKKADAKSYLAKNFENIQVTVEYYFNLLSFTFEPLCVNINDTDSKILRRFFIPGKDLTLLKNLYLVDNSYIDFYSNEDFISCSLNREDITLDNHILKYFISNGKPKYYFNYAFGYDKSSDQKTVTIRDADDTLFHQVLQKDFRECCIGDASQTDYQYLRFDSLKYFVNNNSKIYDIKKQESISTLKEYYFPGKSPIPIEFKLFDPNKYYRKNGNSAYDYMFSPNGKYLALRDEKTTKVYETTSWKPLHEFEGSNGKLYWDCNSYYLGIGEYIIPIKLLERINY